MIRRTRSSPLGTDSPIKTTRPFQGCERGLRQLYIIYWGRLSL